MWDQAGGASCEELECLEFEKKINLSYKPLNYKPSANNHLMVIIIDH